MARAGLTLPAVEAFTTCSQSSIVCNNIFYIQAGKVIRYAPTGARYTDDAVRPKVGYLPTQPPANEHARGRLRPRFDRESG